MYVCGRLEASLGPSQRPSLVKANLTKAFVKIPLAKGFHEKPSSKGLLQSPSSESPLYL